MFLRTIFDTQRHVGAHGEPAACRMNVGWAHEVLTTPMASASLNTNLGSGREGFARRIWPSMFHFTRHLPSRASPQVGRENHVDWPLQQLVMTRIFTNVEVFTFSEAAITYAPIARTRWHIRNFGHVLR